MEKREKHQFWTKFFMLASEERAKKSITRIRNEKDNDNTVCLWNSISVWDKIIGNNKNRIIDDMHNGCYDDITCLDIYASKEQSNNKGKDHLKRVAMCYGKTHRGEHYCLPKG